MARLLKEILDEVEAHNAILAIEDARELQAFIKGERRETLLETAAYRLNFLKGFNSELRTPNSALAKAGEQTGPITHQTADFKGPGVQGTKSDIITGASVVEELDNAALQRATEAAVQANKTEASATKTEAEIRREKGIVTCEDVVAQLREKGKTI
jgi:hypothetical protein